MRRGSDFNQKTIDEFRANRGQTSGPFRDRPLLLLTTTGAKSGRRHTTPVVYLLDGERFVVFASKGGAPTNPDWYHNLVANPTVTVEVGPDTFEANASVATGAQHDKLYARQVKDYPQFGEYQQRTKRQIPVIVLERRP